MSARSSAVALASTAYQSIGDPSAIDWASRSATVSGLVVTKVRLLHLKRNSKPVRAIARLRPTRTGGLQPMNEWRAPHLQRRGTEIQTGEAQGVGHARHPTTAVRIRYGNR
jgi:hypothetical protein